MSNDPSYLTSGSRRLQIRSFVLSEMMRGAGWGALVVFGIALLLWVIYLLGQLLPEQSKNMPDPRQSNVAIVAVQATA